ncbi:MAG: chromate transporter [Paludibacteraceae bacterium]|nr:chromate transporter [Paludibacteraceae bacterium]
MIYLQLFLSFLKVGVLGFGGGMAIISLIEREVTRYGWLTQTEFVDIVAISQVTPGPIGVNCATYVGYTTTGTVWGSLIATIAVTLPGILAMFSLAILYLKIRDRWSNNRTYRYTMYTIRCLVVLLIGLAAYRLMTPASFIDGSSWLIFGIVLTGMLTPLLRKNKATNLLSHPILLILLAGLIGLLLYH